MIIFIAKFANEFDLICSARCTIETESCTKTSDCSTVGRQVPSSFRYKRSVVRIQSLEKIYGEHAFTNCLYKSLRQINVT